MRIKGREALRIIYKQGGILDAYQSEYLCVECPEEPAAYK